MGCEKMKKFKFLENDTTLKIISLAVAVVSWFTVVMFVNTDRTVTIRNVPVVIDEQNSALGTLGLNLISDKEILTDVKVSGERSVVGSVTKDDIYVEAVLTGISEPGTYSVAVRASNANSTKNFNIVSASPDNFSLKFDRSATKKVSVELELGDIQIQDGYVMENIVVSPTTIVVSGPEEDVLKVASCVIREDIDGKLSKSEVFSSKVVLLDNDGKVINNSHLSLSVDEVDVTIPVLKCKTLPLTFSFLNVRPDFDTSNLKYQLSKQTIEVAGPESLIDKMSELNVGYINLEALGDEVEYDFDITLPSSFINIENVTSVSVTFDFADYTEKIVEVKNIELKNIPAHYDVSVSTTKISYVTVMGPTEIMNNIKSGDFVAELDLSEIDITVGQYKVPVSIYAPNNLNVWSKGTYYVVVNIKAK